MKKYLLILFIIGFVSTMSYGFRWDENFGGVATGLGGVVLDKNMQGFNAIYNPNMITIGLKDVDVLDFSAGYTPSPYGVEGINNGGFGVTYGIGLGALKIGGGVGGQFSSVVGGINETRIYIAMSGYYTGLGQAVKLLSFVDGIALGLNMKMMMLSTGVEINLDGFNSAPFGFDMDIDLTVSMFKNVFRIGFMVSDLLEAKPSFFENPAGVSLVKRGMIVHGKFAILNNLDLVTAFNIGGSAHTTTENNFSGSVTVFANTYFGIEANFMDSFYVRIGLNEGKLSGGLGLTIADLTVNVGLQPIEGMNLYYQMDISYRLKGLLKKSKPVVITDEAESDAADGTAETGEAADETKTEEVDEVAEENEEVKVETDETSEVVDEEETETSDSDGAGEDSQ